jgi:hypothetical protein
MLPKPSGIRPVDFKAGKLSVIGLDSVSGCHYSTAMLKLLTGLNLKYLFYILIILSTAYIMFKYFRLYNENKSLKDNMTALIRRSNGMKPITTTETLQITHRTW